MIPALALLLLTSLACVGLLSVWAATSSRHWFVRTGTLVAVLALLLLIPAYEPLVVFVLQGTVIAAGVQGARWWRRRKEGNVHMPRRARFSLATLLLVTVYVTIAAAVVANLPVQGFYAWLSTMLIGVVTGIATLVGLWMVHSRSIRWWWRVALGLVLSLSIALPLGWDDWVFLSFAYPDSSYNIWILVVIGVAGISGVLLWLIDGMAGGNSARFKSRGKRALACAALLLSATVLLVPPATVYYQLMTPLPIPQTVLPDPNGWDDLVAAGKMAESSKELRTINFYDTVPQTQLSAAVKAMAPVYNRLELGLGKQVRCPVEYHDSGRNFDSMSSMRTLSRALAGRGHLEKIEGRFDDAAESFMEGIRHGYALRRGGLIVASLTGSACSGIGRSYLYLVHEELSASHCMSLIEELGRLERQSELIEDIIHRDRVWSQHAYGWQGHLWQILDDMDFWSFLSSFRIACDRERTEMRLLQLELAIQAWRKTVGGLPESLSELVPQIMSEIPVDPFDPAGDLLRYRRTDDGYVLYSIGQNGIDDGGIAPEEEDIGGFESGDFRLDIQYAPEPVEEDAIEDDYGVELEQG